ncbi:MAG: NAD(P)/FAD-dependent oxidoreductase [Chlamydiales bacterium]
MKVIIVGGGIAGLAAAHQLEKYGMAPTILEKSGHLGGRIHTNTKNGFLLDVGFQVLLNKYPELTSEWKKALALKSFLPGALVRTAKGWKTISHPLYDPLCVLHWPKGTFKGLYTLAFALPQPISMNESCDDYLKRLNLDEEWVNVFLKPFLKGVFLDCTLSVRAHRVIELLRYFLWGRACLPEQGMQAVPFWLANQLKRTQFLFNQSVIEVSEKEVRLQGGERFKADHVLITVPLPDLCLLMDIELDRPSCGTICDYFSISSKEKRANRYLWLDGRDGALVNNFCFLNAIQPTYAPKGYHLISASQVGKGYSEEEILDYLASSLEMKTSSFTHLKRYSLEHALPLQHTQPPFEDHYVNGCWVAGEAVSYPSINDAVASGRSAVNSMLRDLNL